MQLPVFVGSAGGLVGELMVLTLIELLKRISPVRQRLKPLMTTTSHAPSPDPGSDAVINAVSVINSSTGEFVLLTISLRDHGGSWTKVTLEGKGGLLRKAAAVVTDLRHWMESSGFARPDAVTIVPRRSYRRRESRPLSAYELHRVTKRYPES